MREELAPDAKIAAAAARQGGVVTGAQLRAAGLSKDAIHRRVRGARLHVIHRGVFAVGHPRLDVVGRWWAAVLACGVGAALSHASAGAAFAIRASAASLVDVSV